MGSISRKGTIAVEEAVISPGTVWFLEEFQKFLTPNDASKDAVAFHAARLSDIHDKRLQSMDAEGVEYMLLSLTSPGCQGIHDQALAEKTAGETNNWLAGEVAKNLARFGGLAALSMHDPHQAAQELERAVKGLGFFGGLVNDFQSTGNGSGKEYYDTAKYDVFWQKVQELDVPIYFHPRYTVAPELQDGSVYGERKYLLGAGIQFHLDLSLHIYAMCSSGVFDRYPGVKILAGHLGEGIPFNLWRASHWYGKPSKRGAYPCKHDFRYYFHHNVFITTSGNFSTSGLKFCIDELGSERCLFSIDTPYDQVSEAQEWWKSIDLPRDIKNSVGRENAIRLFKLPLEI